MTNEIQHASHDGVHALRLKGEIRYPLSPSFDRFLQRLFAGPAPKGFVVDLTETTVIDSTNLGLLARIAKGMDRAGGPKPVLISNQEDINEVIVSMGFDEVFMLVDTPEPLPEPGHVVPLRETDAQTLARTILEAHRTLMDLNERNRDVFQSVVALLEQQGAEKKSME
jgi:anti-anti-sigma factor